MYIPLTKAEWIERYGGQELLDREGFEVVRCGVARDGTDCDDPICHGWRVRPVDVQFQREQAQRAANASALCPSFFGRRGK